ncbi:AP-3 complex subunit sigma [Nosema granulosis]|uniref:AP complex subunit sigma n=1 Tax=Nosema granulosis TaxID=83296 RepID=A0A9P6H1C0_9MICR|nr:AP-3 complex subunit sigma [Nosema granulosis]
MIKKIYIFNENGENRIIRTFRDTLSNEEIQKKISEDISTNFIRLEKESIIFRRYNKIVISLVVENENEMYCLSIISLLMELLNRLFKNITELHLIYHFKDIYELLDKFIAGGYVIETDPDRIILREDIFPNKSN